MGRWVDRVSNQSSETKVWRVVIWMEVVEMSMLVWKTPMRMRVRGMTNLVLGLPEVPLD